MAIGGQGRAAMAIAWLGQAIWPTEGTEEVAETLSLS